MTKKPTRKIPSFVLPLVIIIGLLGYLGLYGYGFVPVSIPLGINEVRNGAGSVNLNFSPSTITGAVDTEVSVPLMADAGGTILTTVQAELKYDPTMISTPTITIGDFLPTALSTPVTNNGKITFTFATPPSGGATGTGTVATFKFKPLKDGTSTISFSTNVMTTSLDSARGPILGNTLRSVENLTIKVGSTSTNNNPENTSNPTSTPTATPNSTATPTATPTSNDISVVTTTPYPSRRPATNRAPATRPAATPNNEVAYTQPVATPYSPTTTTTNNTTNNTTYIDPDNFVTPTQSDTTEEETEQPGFFRKIFMGWGIIFRSIVEFLFG